MNNQTLGLTVTRIALGVILFAHGYLLKIGTFTIAGTVGYFESIGITRACCLSGDRWRSHWWYRINSWHLHKTGRMAFVTDTTRGNLDSSRKRLVIFSRGRWLGIPALAGRIGDRCRSSGRWQICCRNTDWFKARLPNQSPAEVASA